MPLKLYENKAWMTRRYVTMKRTPEQIAAEAGCSLATVYRNLLRMGLIRK